MPNYVIFKADKNVRHLNEEQARDILLRFIDAEKENSRRYREALGNYAEMLKLALIVYGEPSVEVKYLKQHIVPKPQSQDRNRRLFEKSWETELERRDRLKRNQEYRERRRKAEETLVSLGFEKYVHFDENAITFMKTHVIETEPGVYSVRPEESEVQVETPE